MFTDWINSVEGHFHSSVKEIVQLFLGFMTIAKQLQKQVKINQTNSWAATTPALFTSSQIEK